MNIHSIDSVYGFICGRCGNIREFGSMASAEAFMHEHNRMHDTTTSGVVDPRERGGTDMSDEPLDRLEWFTAAIIMTICFGMMALVAGSYW